VRRNVRSVMVGAPRGTQFDAFFSMSTQRSELNPTDMLNGGDLCQNMLDNGFRYCEAYLFPYNGEKYLAETKNKGFLVDNTYPHRTASFFHTISRCADRIRRTFYKNVMFTRLDIYQIMTFHNFRGAFPFQPSKQVIGMKRKATVDDRVMIGPVKYMVHLSGIYAYFIGLPSHTIRLWPEAVLHDFLESYPSHFQLPRPILPKTENFVKLKNWQRNWNKVNRSFTQKLAVHLGLRTKNS